jgi:hypothetical protein
VAAPRLRNARDYALAVGIVLGLLCVIWGGVAGATWALVEMTGCGHHCATRPDTGGGGGGGG